MRRSTIVLIVFAVLAIGIIGFATFLQNQPPYTMTVVVDPLAEDWVRDITDDFNSNNRVLSSNQRIQIELIVRDEIDVWMGQTGWTFDNHPLLWIPASSASVDFVPSSLPFTTIEDSLARTPLVWGGFTSRVNALTNDGQRPFEWGAVREVANAERWQNIGVTENWGNVQMGLAKPGSSMAGVGVLLSAAANHAQTPNLTRNDINDPNFTNWLDPIVASMSNAIRSAGMPVQVMASRGPSTINFAMFPEKQWLQHFNDLRLREDVQFAYPAYQFVLDFPLAMWDDPQTTALEREAARVYADYIVSEAVQTTAVNYGLRPADSEPDPTTAALFTIAEPFGIQLVPDYGLPVTVPGRSEVERLIREVS